MTWIELRDVLRPALEEDVMSELVLKIDACAELSVAELVLEVGLVLEDELRNRLELLPSAIVELDTAEIGCSR